MTPSAARTIEAVGEPQFDVRLHQQLDAVLQQVQRYIQLLPAVTPINGREERGRLVQSLKCGQFLEARFELPKVDVPRQAYRLLSEARALVKGAVFRDLYERKLEELELELQILDAIGEPKRIRPLCARRFGSGSDRVPTEQGERSLGDVADDILAGSDGDREPREVPAEGQPNSVVELMKRASLGLGLNLDIRVDPRLSAGAATGQRTILVADRKFGRNEAKRLTVHEVFGHAVAAANGRSQPIRLFDLGTAGSFADQEGLALCLEEQIGALTGYRLRMIAVRVWIVDRMIGGASFSNTAKSLMTDHGFDALDAVILCERAYRGGGLARDAAYLAGYLRVSAAIKRQPAALHTLRAGRLAVSDLESLPRLQEVGAYRKPWLRPEVPAALHLND